MLSSDPLIQRKEVNAAIAALRDWKFEQMRREVSDNAKPE